MKLMKDEWLQSPTLGAETKARRGRGAREKSMVRGVGVCLLAMALASMAWAQAVSTTTVEGTVYLANGQPGAGTLTISWPSFTTAAGQAVAADRDDGDDRAGRICEREPRAERGSDARGRVLHGRFLHERRVDEHAVLGGSGGGAGEPGAGAGAGDAGGAGGADGEQGVCGPGDRGAERKRADGVGRDAERAAVFERRSDAAVAGGGQALRGYAGGDGGAAGGREYDGRADGAGGEWGAGSGGGERADDAAGGDERGGDAMGRWRFRRRTRGRTRSRI